VAQETISLKKLSENTYSNETVTICSKLPMQYILQLHAPVERVIQAHGGTVRETIHLPRNSTPSKPTRFIIEGCSFAQNKGPHQQIQNGYAITHGIPKDFWDEWLSQYKEMDIVKNGFIFAHKESNSVTQHTKDMANEASGFERIDSSKKYNSGSKVMVNERSKEFMVEQGSRA
jgi:hypothetical protein